MRRSGPFELALGLALAAPVGGMVAFPLQVASEGRPSEALLVLQVLLLVLTGRLLGEALQRIGQPAVMGHLLGGLVLGPSIFGLFWPTGQSAVFPDAPAQRAMLDGLAQIGILLLLLLAGMETDLSLIRKVKRAAVSASLMGIALPFASGFLLGQALPASLLPAPDQRLAASLFLGTALSISSVKIVATVVREMDFVRRNIGQVILASAIVDDTIGWIVIAIIFGLAEHGRFDAWTFGRGVLGTAIFLALSFTLGRRLVFRIIRLTNDHFVSEAPVIAAIVVVMGLMSLVTYWIGVHTVLGAFVAGILVGQSPILTREIDSQIRGVVAGLFMPVFFGTAGLHTDLTVLADPRLLYLTAALLAIASLGKAAGAFAGGCAGGLNVREATALAAGMNARGSTEVIVATIGLSLGVLSQDLFTMIVTMALVTTTMMPPTLRWALRRLPPQGEEKARLDREGFEKRGFVPNMERVLVVVDESPSGKLAARVAGLLAGRKGMPVTVLHLPKREGPTAEERQQTLLEGARSVVHGAAEQAGSTGTVTDDRPPAVEVTGHVHDAPPAEAVQLEMGRGYDLLAIGMEPTIVEKGAFAPDLSEVAQSFDGSLAVALARGRLAGDPLEQSFDVVVPISGSRASIRGAEVALALARAADARVTTLSMASAVSQRKEDGRHARRDDREILREMERMASYFEVDLIRSVARGDSHDALQRVAESDRPCLIVLGVSRRPGKTLSFGSLAAGLLETSDHSLLILST